MINQIRDRNRPHYASIMQLADRDFAFTVGAGLFLCATCFYLGHVTLAVCVAVLIVSSELIIRLACHHRRPLDRLSKDDTLLVVLALCGANSIIYTYPALVLVCEPSIAMKMTGFIWIMGVQIFITNTWSRVPVFLYTMLLPVMMMMVIAFFKLPDVAPTGSSTGDWVIAFAFVVMFIYSSIDTLRQHMATEAALFSSERMASARLAMLEESQRLDSLTGLLNRPAFDIALHVMLQDRASGSGELAVFLVDLDSFKPINDTYSHEAGDQILIETAHRLKKHVGEAGIVGRLGGDEFVCAHHDLTDGADAVAFAESLGAIIARPIEWNQRQLKIVASIGVAMTGDGPPAPAATVSALCSAADQAMFAAKSSPNRTPLLYQSHLFSPRMTPDDKQVLVDSITNGSLKPYYQPKVHLPTGRIIGFEALARWDHPAQGKRLPSEFIEQINELGLQGDFMTCMATQVVRDVAAMLDLGFDPGQVSLNVPEVALATHSGRQDLHRIVAGNPNAINHMTFEITEDVFIARAADMIQASITSFRELGLRISLDDFGTGFASFHHLGQLDFDELKIDTSFVAGLGVDATSDVLVRGFLNMASGLGVSVIAEGVETEAQRQDLINMGCVIAQGYLFSAAVPFASAIDLLRQQDAA